MSTVDAGRPVRFPLLVPVAKGGRDYLPDVLRVRPTVLDLSRWRAAHEELRLVGAPTAAAITCPMKADGMAALDTYDGLRYLGGGWGEVATSLRRGASYAHWASPTAGSVDVGRRPPTDVVAVAYGTGDLCFRFRHQGLDAHTKPITLAGVAIERDMAAAWLATGAREQAAAFGALVRRGAGHAARLLRRIERARGRGEAEGLPGLDAMGPEPLAPLLASGDGRIRELALRWLGRSGSRAAGVRRSRGTR